MLITNKINNLDLYTVIVFGIFVLCLLLGLGFALTMWSAPWGNILLWRNDCTYYLLS